jgi:hypothetical protein
MTGPFQCTREIAIMQSNVQWELIYSKSVVLGLATGSCTKKTFYASISTSAVVSANHFRRSLIFVVKVRSLSFDWSPIRWFHSGRLQHCQKRSLMTNYIGYSSEVSLTSV